MRWERKGHYYLEREDGLFRVAKSYTRGEPIYSLFKRPPLGWSREQGILVGHPYATAELAKAASYTGEAALEEAKRILNDG